jgi:hypothetical protein
LNIGRDDVVLIPSNESRMKATACRSTSCKGADFQRAGNQPGVAAQLMGHKPSAIAERHYTSRPLDLLRAWHVKLEAWILEQAGIEQPKEEQASLRLVKS